MKTKIFLLSLLFLLALGCRKPPFPKPGEPTIDISKSEKPAMLLPWHVVKGTRVACSESVAQSSSHQIIPVRTRRICL